MIKVRVPATSANMGAGFDTFGMALRLYNEIAVEECSTETQIKLIDGKLDKNYSKNLTYESIVKTFEYCAEKYKGFNIDMSKADIPMSRGLGSSAACIIGGIFAANELMGKKLSVDEMLSIAVSIEGHPDNVAPALIGGMITSIVKDNATIYSKVNIKSNLKYEVMIPDFKVSTYDARKVLPNTYSRNDVIYNISRGAMLISALNNGENEKLRYAFEDKIHQPYRKRFIANIDDIFNKCREFGSYGEFISGSGSTLIAVVDANNFSFNTEIREFLNTLSSNWQVIELGIDNVGAKVIAL